MMNTRNELHDLVSLMLLMSCLICLCGCNWERPTAVAVGPGPSFVLRGSGRLASFTISAPLSGQKVAFPCNKVLFPCSGVATVMWQIESSKGYVEGAHVEGFQVKYGKVPNGYTQVVPSQSQSVSPLPPGFIYSFSAETTDAAGQSGYFYVDGAGTVQVLEVTDLCLTSQAGRQVRVNCRTKDPYKEPTDVEMFAREHQKR